MIAAGIALVIFALLCIAGVAWVGYDLWRWNAERPGRDRPSRGV